MADEDAADGAHQVADSEDAERRQQLRDGAFIGKKLAPDLHGKKAVDGKVVPLEHVADHARADRATGGLLMCLHSVPPLRGPAEPVEVGG
jgi:hypothetical protein